MKREEMDRYGVGESGADFARFVLWSCAVLCVCVMVCWAVVEMMGN